MTETNTNDELLQDSLPGSYRHPAVVYTELDSSDEDREVFFSGEEEFKVEVCEDGAFTDGVGRSKDLMKHINDPRISTRTGSLPSALRIIFCDVPLAVIFALVVASLSVEHIYQTYYAPLMSWLEFYDTPREENEGTYYHRECTAEDVTTRSTADLIVPPDESPHDATIRTQKHGMAVFPRVVSGPVAKRLREYIMERNAALRPSDMDYIGLIGQDQRWSFKLGAEHPSVPPALREIATHTKLRPVLDELLGDDASLVELTAITSAYGATDQHYHQDNRLGSCQMGNARSFASMYSIFIPLQDTTAKMGVTDVVAGTHYCYDYGDIANNKANTIRVVGSRGNYAEYRDVEESEGGGQEEEEWKVGDAFLFDTPVVHRGSAHTDPNGEDRVMLILTVSPRPRGPGLDTRQLGLGSSYSNRWDMWGLSMTDLENMEEAMKQPWRTLRTLGIYKRPSEGKWGWDMLTVTAARIINYQFGYREDEMEEMLQLVKQTNFLARYLFYHHDAEWDWLVWVEKTMSRAKKLLCGMYACGTFIYVADALVVRFEVGKKTNIFARLVVPNVVILCVALLGLVKIWQTPWGQDLRNSKASPVFVNTTRLDTRKKGPTKFPVRSDVLIGTRLHSPWLASHNRILDFHPGNVVWKDAIRDLSNHFHYLPAVFHDDVINSINNIIYSNSGAFLLQNGAGDWIVLSDEDAKLFTRRSLVEDMDEVVREMNKEISYLISECRFGSNRESALARKHCTDLMERLQKQIFGEEVTNSEPGRLAPAAHLSSAIKSMSMMIGNKRNAVKARTMSSKPVLPMYAAVPSRVYSKDDEVVAFLHSNGGNWFQASIARARADGSYDVTFVGNTTKSYGFPSQLLRPISDMLTEGEAAEAEEETEEMTSNTITSTNIFRLTRVGARFTCDSMNSDGSGDTDFDCTLLMI